MDNIFIGFGLGIIGPILLMIIPFTIYISIGIFLSFFDYLTNNKYQLVKKVFHGNKRKIAYRKAT